MKSEFQCELLALRVQWYGIGLICMPFLLTGAILMDYNPQHCLGKWESGFPGVTEWVLAIMVLSLSVIAGKAIFKKKMEPKKIARRSLPFGVQTETPTEHAKVLILRAMGSVQLAYLLPSLLLGSYTFVTGNFQWIMVATIFMTTMVLVSRPNLEKLLKETEVLLDNVN